MTETITPSKQSEKLKTLIQQSLEDDKAEHIVIINLAGKSDMADYMVIASGRSAKHVGSIAENLNQRIKASKILTEVPMEGTHDCNWVLVDAFDVVVHLFRPEVREFYNLEKMWEVALPENSSAVT